MDNGMNPFHGRNILAYIFFGLTYIAYTATPVQWSFFDIENPIHKLLQVFCAFLFCVVGVALLKFENGQKDESDEIYDSSDDVAPTSDPYGVGLTSNDPE